MSNSVGDSVRTAETRDLLTDVGMLDSQGNLARSNPLANPSAFKELVSRLSAEITAPYDVIVVRDLFGDRVLGYQLSLLADKPVAVSYDQEGIIFLENRSAIHQGSTILIVADTHFTAQSIQAAASGAEQAGMEVTGAAIFLQVVDREYSFPVWVLEQAK